MNIYYRSHLESLMEKIFIFHIELTQTQFHRESLQLKRDIKKRIQ